MRCVHHGPNEASVALDVQEPLDGSEPILNLPLGDLGFTQLLAELGEL
jgi:hypothetical protein